MSRSLKDAAYAELARIGKALASPVRVEILDVLSQAPRDVESLAGAISRPVASTSQHLQVLAAARLVVRERDGVRRIYGLADGVDQLLATVERAGFSLLAELPAHRADHLAEHPTVQAVTDAEVHALVARGEAVLVDVRPEAEFHHVHLPGARSVPLAELEDALADLPPDIEIIACCRGPWCDWADEAVERLQAAGRRARRFEGRPYADGSATVPVG